jgi:hypothetical protein
VSALAEYAERVDRQRGEALQRANAVRTYRREVKDQLTAAEIRFEQIITEPDDRLLTARVVDLLRAIPGVGKEHARGWQRGIRITPETTVEALTDRQRDWLVRAVGSHERGQTWRRRRVAAERAGTVVR